MTKQFNPEESLLELAHAIVEQTEGAQTLDRIRDQVFAIKGFDAATSRAQAALFEADFMLSGYFVVCGENGNGEKMWDLKKRRKTELLDKQGTDTFADEEEQREVEENELSEENIEKIVPVNDDDQVDSDKTVAEIAANVDAKTVKPRPLTEDNDDEPETEHEPEGETKDDIEQALEDDDTLPEDSYDDDDKNR